MKTIKFVEMDQFAEIVFSMTTIDFNECYGINFQVIPKNCHIEEDKIGWYRVGIDQWFESGALMIGGWTNPLSIFNLDSDYQKHSLDDIRGFIKKYFDTHVSEWIIGNYDGIIKIEFD